MLKGFTSMHVTIQVAIATLEQVFVQVAIATLEQVFVRTKKFHFQALEMFAERPKENIFLRSFEKHKEA